MDKGWVKINCPGVGNCIHIHKVTTQSLRFKTILLLQALGGCSVEDSMLPAHLELVRGLCQGKQQCEVKPVATEFGVSKSM